MSALHIQSRGAGPDLVLLHGWGMHSGVWAPLLPVLETGFRVHCVDLPGHGHSPLPGSELNLAIMAELVTEAVQPRLSEAGQDHAWWAGWSLGGMLALQIAAGLREQMAGLILIAAAPRFSQAPDWPAGMDAKVLQAFARELAVDPVAVRQRFLALQVAGTPAARDTLRQLREAMGAAPAPGPAALQAGLAILQESDLRDSAGQLPQAVLLIGGERDRLVHPDALRAAGELLPRARLEMIEAAGHAPFVSHPAQVATQIQEFCSNGD